MKHMVIHCLLLVAAVTAGTACASGYANSDGRLADVAIVDRDSGRILDAHYCRGEYWVAATPGARYSIAIHNRSSERLLAVTSVDGVNIVSGETAGWQQTGYVLEAGQRYEVLGWRKSEAVVAAFSFTAPPDSYAARTGRDANLGIIGVAVFRERPPMATAPPITYAGEARVDDSQSRMARAKEASNALRSVVPGLGTAHGERELSYVGHTDFVRAQSEPDETIRIRYDRLETLIAMGVISHPRAPPRRPDPFPDSSGRFVPDPPGG